jgi:hypothetical protein
MHFVMYILMVQLCQLRHSVRRACHLQVADMLKSVVLYCWQVRIKNAIKKLAEELHETEVRGGGGCGWASSSASGALLAKTSEASKRTRS